ncbi:MAG: hypothetical protein HRU31_17735 [Rhodobacteraceae bacterium]|nr:hypothetical protein [Paracoccaceae bacterium]
MKEDTNKRCVLMVLSTFLQISQTYIRTEIQALEDSCELLLLSRNPPNLSYENPPKYVPISTMDDAIEQSGAFRPDVIHAHYMHQFPFVAERSARLGVPYTLRSHSFDIIPFRNVGKLSLDFSISCAPVRQEKRPAMSSAP